MRTLAFLLSLSWPLLIHSFEMMAGSCAPVKKEPSLNLCSASQNPYLEPRFLRDWFIKVSGEFLYWKWNSTDPNYLRTGVGLSNSTPSVEVNVTKNGKAYTPEYQFDPGFRIQGALQFKQSDITARYTCFQTNPKSEFHRDTDLVAAAASLTWGNVPVSALINFASMHMDLDYNWIDLLAGYSFDVSDHLYFRPYTGLSAFFIHAHLKVFYDFLDALNREESITFLSQFSEWGIGPALGIESNWNFVKNWSLYSSCGLFLPILSQKIKGYQTQEIIPLNQEFVVNRGKIQETLITFCLDFCLGPRWDCWFYQNKYHLSIHLGAEILFFNGTFIRFLNTANTAVSFPEEVVGINAGGSFEF